MRATILILIPINILAALGWWQQSWLLPIGMALVAIGLALMAVTGFSGDDKLGWWGIGIGMVGGLMAGMRHEIATLLAGIGG